MKYCRNDVHGFHRGTLCYAYSKQITCQYWYKLVWEKSWRTQLGRLPLFYFLSNSMQFFCFYLQSLCISLWMCAVHSTHPKHQQLEAELRTPCKPTALLSIWLTTHWAPSQEIRLLPVLLAVVTVYQSSSLLEKKCFWLSTAPSGRISTHSRTPIREPCLRYLCICLCRYHSEAMDEEEVTTHCFPRAMEEET